jgi:hypothetical protein
MAKEKMAAAPKDKVKLYEKLIATNPKVERKGATLPYTALNGHMFSYLHQSGLVALKLPRDQIDGFLKKYDTKLFEAYGVVQKEFVTVPDHLLAKTNELKKYFDMSYEYVSSLKPKPTRKKT